MKLRRHHNVSDNIYTNNFTGDCEQCPAKQQKEKTLRLFEHHTYLVRKDAKKYLDIVRLETLIPGLVIDSIQDPYVYAESVCNGIWIAPLEEGIKRTVTELNVLSESAVNCTGVEYHGPFNEGKIGTPLNRIIGVIYCPVALRASLLAEAQQSVRHNN